MRYLFRAEACFEAESLDDALAKLGAHLIQQVGSSEPRPIALSFSGVMLVEPLSPSQFN